MSTTSTTPPPATRPVAAGLLRSRAVRTGAGALLLLGYAGLLLVAAARASLWGDEGYTAATVDLPWGRLLADLTRIDLNMGVYYVAAKATVTVLGGLRPETALRVLPVLAITVAVPLVARLARRTTGGRGWSAALIFAINPFTMVVAATARPYALLVLGTVVTALLLLSALDEARPTRWLLWAAAGGLLLYVHLLAALVLAGQGLFALWCTRRQARRRWLRELLPAGLLLALALVPTLIWIAPPDTLNWVPAPTPLLLVGVPLIALGGPLYALPLVLLALVGLIGSIGLLRPSGRADQPEQQPGAPRPEALLVGFLLAVPALAVLLLLPFQSLLVDEYLSPLLVPVSVLAAHGVTVARSRAGGVPRRGAIVRGVLLGALALGALVTTGHRMQAGTFAAPQDWKGAVTRLNRQVGPGDGVGFPNAFYRIVAEYYARHPSPDVKASPFRPFTVEARPLLPAAPWHSLRPYEIDRIKRLGLQADPEVTVSEAAGLATVWLAGPEDDEVTTAAVTALQGHGYRVTSVESLRGVVLTRLARA